MQTIYQAHWIGSQFLNWWQTIFLANSNWKILPISLVCSRRVWLLFGRTVFLVYQIALWVQSIFMRVPQISTTFLNWSNNQPKCKFFRIYFFYRVTNFINGNKKNRMIFCLNVIGFVLHLKYWKEKNSPQQTIKIRVLLWLTARENWIHCEITGLCFGGRKTKR